jgi:hypothetical protein
MLMAGRLSGCKVGNREDWGMASSVSLDDLSIYRSALIVLKRTSLSTAMGSDLVFVTRRLFAGLREEGISVTYA